MDGQNLTHHGILGMKWGVRRTDAQLGHPSVKKREYGSTGIRAAIARRQNAKVDKGFERWKVGEANRDNAIAAGKKASASRMAAKSDPKNKDLRTAAKADAKAYKKALRSNTTYRKGTVKQEVLRDSARLNMSAAKRVEKLLKADPTNKALAKQYAKLMSQHDIDRAKGRKAQDVAARRSNAIAGMKRARTIAIKSAAASAAIAVGTKVANSYLQRNGGSGITSDAIRSAIQIGKKIKKAASYI